MISNIQVLWHVEFHFEMTVLEQIWYIYTPLTTEPIRWQQPNSCPIRFETHMWLIWLCDNFDTMWFFSHLQVCWLVVTLLHFDGLTSKVVIRHKSIISDDWPVCKTLHQIWVAQFGVMLCIKENHQIKLILIKVGVDIDIYNFNRSMIPICD